MSAKPAARLGDPTACPKTGHGNNPIATGSPDVTFDGLPAARQGDSTGCGSALSGNLIPNVLINGKPAATLGSLGNHGNVIVAGSGTVVIGTSHTPAGFAPPSPLHLAPAAFVAEARAVPPAPLVAEGPASEAPVEPVPHGREEEEEEEELSERQAVTLRIGVFFDGTGNNASNSAIGAQCRAAALGIGEQTSLAIAQRCEFHHLDPDSSYGNDVSNIWRLYDLHPDNSGQALPEGAEKADSRIYVNGIGTTSGEPDSIFPGQAIGRGSTGVVAKVDEGVTLLVQAVDNFVELNPATVLARLELNIFGFSRGAAAARHFANQILLKDKGPLGELRRTGKLGKASGFDWQSDVLINFIGLFDTVAAVGGWSDWGDPSDDQNADVDLYLAPDAARHVVQLAARDEHRLNFALNRVARPHREIVLPGAHSDLGGGYPAQTVERLYLARPQSNWVVRDTDPYRTAAYHQAQRETERLQRADLLDPKDATAQLRTDVWVQFMPYGGGRDDRMKHVMAAPYLERKVYGHLSRVYLRVMQALAVEAGVPLNPIQEKDPALALPEELVPISGKLMAWVKAGSGSLTGEEERLLRRRYIHLSANWNAAAGASGGKLDVNFINAPANPERMRYADKPLGKK
ncbi:type IV secretion protein Rhs [Stutzerimonas urumqiensis]|uniref:PAAR domain-containing protein n=1 Tax=Stutzerimonas urumqiensis TaxID=638269 RepID=UPI003BAA7733